MKVRSDCVFLHEAIRDSNLLTIFVFECNFQLFEKVGGGKLIWRAFSCFFGFGLAVLMCLFSDNNRKVYIKEFSIKFMKNEIIGPRSRKPKRTISLEAGVVGSKAPHYRIIDKVSGDDRIGQTIFYTRFIDDHHIMVSGSRNFVTDDIHGVCDTEEEAYARLLGLAREEFEKRKELFRNPSEEMKRVSRTLHGGRYVPETVEFVDYTR